ncbi:hypothetical protein GCM10028820_24830 [Tessaracoccus terricola]
MTHGRLLLRVVLFGWLVLAPALAAGADGGGHDVESCTSTGQVWLLVQDETGRVLANQCVGTPASGAAALRAGGLDFETSRGGVICSVAGNPAECPRRFTGQFWQYWHSEPAGPWVFADKGPTNRTPRPGSLEGWCYNTTDERRCTLPEPGAVADLGVTTNPPVSGSASGSPVALIATVTVLAAGGVGFWLWNRRRRHPEDQWGLPPR